MSSPRSSRSPKPAEPAKPKPSKAVVPVPAMPAAPPPRHPYGPRPLAALLPAVTKPAFARRPAASAQLLADWELIVGAQFAAQTQPRKLAGGTLTVVCSGPVALELQHTADVLIARINRHMGHALVQRLRLMHDTVSAAPRRAPAPAAVSAADKAAVERRLADLPDGPLREALAGLALAMRRG